jgi:hypothetical protein
MYNLQTEGTKQIRQKVQAKKVESVGKILLF